MLADPLEDRLSSRSAGVAMANLRTRYPKAYKVFENEREALG